MSRLVPSGSLVLVLVLALGLVSEARADALDAKAIARTLAACGPADDVARLGPLERVETIGTRKASEVVHVIGKRARGYVVFQDEGCAVIPVVGKPAAFTKGTFGGGAKVAYALSGGPSCEDASCVSVVSLKDGERLVDLVVLSNVCTSMKLTRRAVFSGRDSLEVGCFTSGGADQGRTDYLLDTKDGALTVALEVDAGVGWVQVDDNPKAKQCTARIPGGLRVAGAGAKPAIEVTTPATEAEATAAKVEHLAGGCDATVTRRRFEPDASGRWVATVQAPKVTIARKLCSCRRR